MSLPTSKSRSWEMFNRIASKYDVINRVLSFGIDIWWRKQLIKKIPSDKPIKYLDLATGTGDLLYTVAKHRNNLEQALGMDLSEGMLKQAEKKLQKWDRKLSSLIQFKKGDAGSIPLTDSCVDVVTISFGIRNVPDVGKCLKEFHRILQPQGLCCVLEFSLPTNFLVKPFYLFYLRHILPTLGRILSGDREAYTYLNKTIETFPYGSHFSQLLEEAGFKAGYKTLTFGIVTLYWGIKDG